MGESDDEIARQGWRPMREADATGYKRPIPASDGSVGGMLRAPDVLGDTAPAHPGPDRLLADWPLAVKSILFFWLFYFAITAMRVAITDIPGQAEMMRRRLMVIALACLVSFLVYLVLRLLRSAPMRYRLIAAGLVTLPAALLLAGFNYYVFYIYAQVDAIWGGNSMEGWPLAKILAYETHGWYFFNAAWAALYVALSTARDLRAADQRAAAFAREAQEAQLRALRYQINPHFLFNTLNSLSALVLARRHGAAERMLLNLSAFFRTTLAADPTADVPLAEEISLQRLYLEIEQARFPDRLKVEIDVPEALAGRRVPALILQPIVENSVKYGVAKALRPVTVRIAAHEEAGRLHIIVTDDGENGGAGDDDAGGSMGVGLRNVRDRLASRFGGAAKIAHGMLPEGGYRVALILPAAP